MMHIIHSTSAPTSLSPAHQNLANALAAIHGDLSAAQERSGLHFYIACPDCLQEEGENGLVSRHLAINADKVIAGRDRAALCMKCDTVFSVKGLLAMDPLEKRGYQRGPPRITTQLTPAGDFLEPDAEGRLVPKGPGEILPLESLPADHPCIYYIRSRGFEPEALTCQFGACFCLRERSDIRYRRLPGGFRATPQGRLILPIWQNGACLGWQGRLLEATDDDYRYVWHPYRDEWVTVESRATPQSPWQPMEGYEGLDLPRYITGHGTRRNQCLMGYDAAIAYNRENHVRKAFCFLVEGGLDAARLGTPAIATLGKYFSPAQAELVNSVFQKVILVPDNDEAGRRLVETVTEALGGTGKLTVATLPAQFKDAGEMDAGTARAFVNRALAKAFNLPPPGSAVQQ